MYVVWLYKIGSQRPTIRIRIYKSTSLFCLKKAHKCISNPPFYVYSGPTYAFILVNCCYVAFSARTRNQTFSTPRSVIHPSQLKHFFIIQQAFQHAVIFNSKVHKTVINSSQENTWTNGRALVKVWNQVFLYYFINVHVLITHPSAVKQSKTSLGHRSDS